MVHNDDEWRQKFAELAPVPFTESLEQRILQAAQQQVGARRHSLTSWWRTATASLGGVVAAGLMVLAAWNYGAQSPPSSFASWSSNAAKEAGTTVNGPYNGSYGFKLAPISVGFGASDAPLSSDGVVQGTLTNVGTSTIRPSDVVAVLSLQPKGVHGLLKNTQWITFVDVLEHPIAPGETTTWAFKPIGVPTGNGQALQPQLLFLKQGAVEPAQADFVWRRVPLSVSDAVVTPRQHWDKGQSFTVRVRVKNEANSEIHLSDLLAVIWFSNDSDGDWTKHADQRFMYHVTGSAGDTLQPGASTTVEFQPIGDPNVDFLRQSKVHVAFIWR